MTEHNICDMCLESYQELESELARVKAEVAKSTCKLCQGTCGNHALECPENPCKWKALCDKLVEALRKISVNKVRIEYRHDDLAHFEPSEMAKIAKSVLSEYDGERGKE